MIISNSEVSDFLKCEQYWFNKYVRELSPKGFITGPLAYGIYGHEWLAEYFKTRATGGTSDDGIAESNKLISKHLQDGMIDTDFMLHLIGILYRYVEAYPDNNMEILAVEEKLIAPISERVTLGITVDAIVKATAGKLEGETFILDHKFTNNFWSIDRVAMSPQLPKYIYVARANNFDINRGLLNQLRYRKMKEENDFFRRTPVAPSEARINNIIEAHLRVSEEIYSIKTMYDINHETPYLTKLMDGYRCDGCQFFSMCDAELNGKSTDSIVKAHFNIGKDDYVRSYEEV